MFQSTRPRGARPTIKELAQAHGVFQSTRPRGARLATTPSRLRYGKVSIHAPAWGATERLARGSKDVGAFQSTRPRGARPSPKSKPIALSVGFNPRARVGRDA